MRASYEEKLLAFAGTLDSRQYLLGRSGSADQTLVYVHMISNNTVNSKGACKVNFISTGSIRLRFTVMLPFRWKQVLPRQTVVKHEISLCKL